MPDETKTKAELPAELRRTQRALAAAERRVQLQDAAADGERSGPRRDRSAEILQATDLGTWEWNLQTGEAVFNERWAGIIGYALAELEPVSYDTWLRYAHPDDVARSERVLQDCFEHKRERYSLDCRMKHRDGRWIWVRTVGKVASWTESGQPIWMFGTHEDITESKRIEEELRKSRLLLDKLFTSIPDMLSVQDRDLNIVYANWKGFGAVDPAKRKLGTKCYATYRGFDERCPDCEAGSVFDTGEAVEVQKQVLEGLWTDVRAFPIFNDEGEVEYLVEWVRDISAMKRSETALYESEDRFRSITEQSSDVIALTDTQGIITYISPAASTTFGGESADMVGQPFIKFLDESAVDTALQAFRQTFGPSGQTTRSLELLMKRKDGTRFVGELNGALFRSAGAQGTLVVIRDISERKQAEAEKTRLQQQLHQAQKMESIGRLAGGVAHDFNNLLTAITGNVSLTLMDLSPEDPLVETLTEIDQAAASAADLTRQLLAFSRKQIIQPRVLDLNALIDNLRKMLRRLIGEDVELRPLLSERIGRVKADPGQLEQVLVNLVVNARDAMPRGGLLTIETADVELDASFCELHTPLTPGPYVLMAISDTGQGMDNETRLRVFEPFFTTKREGEGTGLGLSTVYGIVQQHDGHIEVYSELGRGTTFKVYLPAVAERAEAFARVTAVAPPPRGKESVLVVEDEDVVRSIAVKTLERLGYEAHSAASGPDALALVRKKDLQVDLLLTDVIMPHMNGPELAEALSDLIGDVKVMYTSGYTRSAISHHDIVDRRFPFIAKPYSPQALARRVREVLDGE